MGVTGWRGVAARNGRGYGCEPGELTGHVGCGFCTTKPALGGCWGQCTVTLNDRARGL